MICLWLFIMCFIAMQSHVVNSTISSDSEFHLRIIHSTTLSGRVIITTVCLSVRPRSLLSVTEIRLFADDTCIFVTVNQRNQDSALVNEDLLTIQKWASDWLVTFSPPKTESLIISTKPDRHLNSRVTINNETIKEVTSHKYCLSEVLW